MRNCPQCQQKTLALKNIFSLRYQCRSCDAVCTSTTAHKAVGTILSNVLPVFGVLLAILTRNPIAFVLGAVLIPGALCWWHQHTAALHVVAPPARQ